MRTEIGTVTRLDGPWAYVEPADAAQCGKCTLCRREGREIRMRNGVGAGIGDRVRFTLDIEEIQRGFHRWNLLALVFLLGGLFLGYGAGVLLGWRPEPPALVGALGGLAAAFPLLRRLQRPAQGVPEIRALVKEE